MGTLNPSIGAHSEGDCQDERLGLRLLSDAVLILREAGSFPKATERGFFSVDLLNAASSSPSSTPSWSCVVRVERGRSIAGTCVVR